MAYVSLFRKYRPQTFEDVVGQEHVTTTLQNAIRAGRVASGYLFTGTRGTAKTTCARILAKALNCIGPHGDLTSPSPEPCSVCGPCRAIAASSFVDVLEMDAASHGKVDDVRDLVASIKFPPMEGRYKVYIIDEAHQLSRDAMDAFLKTLEEPPDRVVFILATTELEKLPITIASRCQVFEFKRGSVVQIATRLAAVCQAEDVAADMPALTLVARAADGSYRDSLSLLEQVLAYKRTGVTPSDVAMVLGTVDEDVLNRVVSLIADSDAAGAFAVAGEILSSGKDVRQFLKSLSVRFRDMLFVSVGAQASVVGDLDDSNALRQLAGRFAPSSLLHILEVLTEAERETRFNNQHRLLLEMALLRLMRLPQAPIAITTAPAAPIANHVAATPIAPAKAIPALVEEPRPAPVVKAKAPDPEPEILIAVVPVEIAPEPSLDIPTMDLSDELESEDEESDLLDEIDDPEELELLELDDSPVIAAVSIPGVLDEDEDDDLAGMPSMIVTSIDEPEYDDLLQVQQIAAPIAPPVTASKHPVPDETAHPTLRELQKRWQEVINRMSSRSPSGGAVVRDASPVAFSGSAITLAFTSAFNVDSIEKNERRRQAIEDVINKTLDVDMGTYRIKCVLKSEFDNVKARSTNTVQSRTLPAPPPPQEEEHSPLMDEVIAIFGGRVLEDHELKG